MPLQPDSVTISAYQAQLLAEVDIDLAMGGPQQCLDLVVGSILKVGKDGIFTRDAKAGRGLAAAGVGGGGWRTR